jgi:predicted amidohydrolase
MAFRLVATSLAVATASSYRAAVVEFSPDIADEATAGDAQAMRAHRLKNLQGLEAFAREAKANGTQIMVFPEYGITGDGVGQGNIARKTVTHFLEDDTALAGPKPQITLPCGDAVAEESAPTIARTSCLAKELEMILVINLLTKQSCDAGLDGCPDDGMRVYNTAVAFAEDGRILSLYHKRHPYGDEILFVQKGEDMYRDGVAFTSSFGVKFGMFICFDILFFTDGGPDALEILYPTDWVNDVLGPIPEPLSAHVAQKSWSALHHKNLLAANYGGFGKDSSGSGIWNKGTALASFYNPTKEPQNMLLIADVPILAAQEGITV